MTLHDTLIHAVIEFDRKESTKKYYNMYALPQYIARVQEVTQDIANGADTRRALTAAFTGRLLVACLKAAGLPKADNSELRGIGGAWYYVPASESK